MKRLYGACINPGKNPASDSPSRSKENTVNASGYTNILPLSVAAKNRPISLAHSHKKRKPPYQKGKAEAEAASANGDHTRNVTRCWTDGRECSYHYCVLSTCPLWQGLFYKAKVLRPCGFITFYWTAFKWSLGLGIKSE